jgi:hypothetical protein
VVGPHHLKICLSVGIIIPNGVENFEKILDNKPSVQYVPYIPKTGGKWGFSLHHPVVMDDHDD